MKTYLAKLEETVKKNWNKNALCNYQGEEFTYCDLATNIEKIHIFFAAAGIQKGDRIAICARNNARWATSFLAVSTYGAVVVPILADFMPSSVESLSEHSDSRMLFCDSDIWGKMKAENIPGLKAAVNVRDFTLLYAENDAVKDAFGNIQNAFNLKYPMGFTRECVHYGPFDESSLAIINYTSGTTSSPKGVMLTYGNISSTVEFSQAHVKCTGEDSVVSMLPLAHMYGLAIEFIYPCCSGAAVYFLGKTPSPTLLMKAMKDVKPYMVVSVPLVMEKVYKSSIKPVISKWQMKLALCVPGLAQAIYRKIGAKIIEAFGGKVRWFIMGGAALNPEVEKCFKKIKLPYTVGYGMTEACPLLCWAAPVDYVPGSCGKPCHSIRIDSEDPQHIAGEIQAAGPNICLGYWKNPIDRSLVFTDDGYLHTGDLGIFDKKGNLFIKGRSKSMILSANGQNIYPEELEAVINSQDYVAESVVVDRASKIVALVYLDRDAIKKAGLDDEAVSDIPETVRTNSNRKLPSYSQITKVEVVLEPFEKTPKMSIKRFLYK